jgi:hypothetical protein
MRHPHPPKSRTRSTRAEWGKGEPGGLVCENTVEDHLLRAGILTDDPAEPAAPAPVGSSATRLGYAPPEGLTAAKSEAPAPLHVGGPCV